MEHDNEHATGSRSGSFSENKPGVIAVIPTFNDEQSVGSVCLKAKHLVAKIIVVDDGSKDRTADVAAFAGAEVIALQRNSGKGFAVLAGLKKAYDLGCSVAVLIDGDARYKTREIPWVTTMILNGEADVVIGSRYLELNGNLPVKQRIKQKMLNLPEPAGTDLKLTDPFSGFIAFSRRALETVDFFYDGPDFRQHLLTSIVTKNMSIREIAISERAGIPQKIFWESSFPTVVALPAYNEEDCLPKVIDGAKAYVDAVIVVDDGSTDATATIAREMGAIVVQHPENRGYGATLQTIFSTARDLNVDALVIMDSDGQHNPQDIENVLLPLLDGADVVIGSRFLDKTKNQVPSYRKVGMKVLDTATSVAGVKNVTDTQSGFRAYGKKAIQVIDISGNGMSGGSEILIQISDKHLVVAEVPITVRYDIKNTSTQNPVSHGISVLGNIIALISYRRPLPAFGIPGVILIILGLGASFVAFSEYYVTTKFPFVLSMMGVLFLILGLLMGIAGLILNALVVIVRENRGK